MTEALQKGSLCRLLAALCCAGSVMSANAACGYTETGGQLGSVTSFRIQSGAPVTASGNFNLDCGRSLLNIGAPKLTAQVVSPTTGLSLKKSGSSYSIPYTLATPGGSPYTQGGWVINLAGINLISLLADAGANVPFLVTTAVGSNIPAGLYTDTITVNWNYEQICTTVICLGNGESDNTNRSITLQLLVSNDCVIAAPPISFGSGPLPSTFASVHQSLSIRCTRDVVYTVGISTGTQVSGTGRRQMASGGNRLEYDIFKTNGAVWGSNSTNRLTTPVADGNSAAILPYTATVYADQPTAPAGNYQDTLTVDIQY